MAGGQGAVVDEEVNGGAAGIGGGDQDFIFDIIGGAEGVISTGLEELPAVGRIGGLGIDDIRYPSASVSVSESNSTT